MTTFKEWRRTQDEFCDDPACRVPWCDVQRPGWDASAARYAPLVEACKAYLEEKSDALAVHGRGRMGDEESEQVEGRMRSALAAVKEEEWA